MCLLSCSETGCWALAPGEDLIAKLGIRVNPIISFIYLFISKHMQKQLLEQKAVFINYEN